MQINQQTVDKLIGHELLTSWENGFIESVSDQLKRGRSLSSNQERVVNRCIEKTTPEKIAEREEWVKEYRAKHRETALLCARYYKEQGYFQTMVLNIMEKEDFVPSRENYTKCVRTNMRRGLLKIARLLFSLVWVTWHKSVRLLDITI